MRSPTARVLYYYTVCNGTVSDAWSHTVGGDPCIISPMLEPVQYHTSWSSAALASDEKICEALSLRWGAARSGSGLFSSFSGQWRRRPLAPRERFSRAPVAKAAICLPTRSTHGYSRSRTCSPAELLAELRSESDHN